MQEKTYFTTEYPKIQTVFKRDPETKHKTLLFGQYSLPAFEFLKDNQWVFTEKVDGTNIRVLFDVEKHEFRGRSNDAQMPPKLLKALEAMFVTEKLCEVFPDAVKMFESGSIPEIVLYGEGYGATIQKGGGNYRAEPSFVLFDVKINGMWLERPNVEDIASKLGIMVAPIIGEGNLHDMICMVESGIVSQWGAFAAEGIVARPKCELKTRNGERIITKLKAKDFAK